MGMVPYHGCVWLGSKFDWAQWCISAPGWFCGSRKWEGPAALGGERIASEHTHPALWVEDYELVLTLWVEHY